MCNGTSLNTNKVPKEKPDRQVAIIIVCAACALKMKRGGGRGGENWRPRTRPTSPQVSVIRIPYNIW